MSLLFALGMGVSLLPGCRLPGDWNPDSPGAAGDTGPESAAPGSSSAPRNIPGSLRDCIETALEKNESRPVAQAAVAVAEAQHRQALAAYWPQITATVGGQLRDEDMNFMQPEIHVPVNGIGVDVPAMSMQTPATSVTLPANALGPGFPPRAVQVPVPSQNVSLPGRTLSIPDMNIVVPEREVTQMDRLMGTAKTDLKWLLWDGGARKAVAGQAKSGIQVAREEVRRTHLEITRDVIRYYYGAVLAGRLLTVARDTRSRMGSTLELTERLYKNGSEKVLKTDYLRNKVMVETLDGMIRALEGNRELAEAALTFTMGLDWRERVAPTARDLPVTPPGSLDQFIGDSYEFSPDWRKLEAGLEAAAMGVKAARAGHLPKLALTGSLHTFTTGANGVGMATDENRSGWTVGMGFEIPLWDGFLTKNRIAEAKARLETMRHRRLQLEQGLALQVKTGFIRARTAALQHEAGLRAVASARENRDLSEKGLSVEMIEPDKVFESQLMEALAEARSLKAAYDHIAARAELEYTAGVSAAKTLASMH